MSSGRWMMAAGLIFLVASAPTASGTPLYKVTDLGSDYRPVAMNDSGQVVGVSSQSPGLPPYGYGPWVAGVYRDGRWSQVPSPAPTTSAVFAGMPIYSSPIGITRAGDVVFSESWTWKDGPLTRDRVEYRTTASNSEGWQIGVATDYHWSNLNGGQNEQRSILLSPASARTGSVDSDDVASAGGLAGDPAKWAYNRWRGVTTAAALNDHLEVAGTSQPWPGDPSHAYLRDRTGKSVDLGTLGGSYSSSAGLNNLGEVVGTAETANGTLHAFVYRDGKMIDLAPDSIGYSIASAINDAGVIVGRAEDEEGNFGALFRDGTALRLDQLVDASSGWLITSAITINQAGWILAEGEKDGVDSYLLLTPLDETPVPEPSVLIVLGVGGLVVSRRLRNGFNGQAARRIAD
ncbi:hypothetical protein [Paludisphaera rhizosphaerae]|uniref:hypothetical protein n=1 Tax=Paludisphaera rhizosphaerae TaxID=2711216 RepID=UPI0013EE329F|nr:hypothetical protein [Paludisphaera rhizosphaerae]